MLIPFVLAAVLGAPDAGFASTPAAPEAIVVQGLSRVGSGLPGDCVAIPLQDSGAVLDVAQPSKSASLVEARVLEKYRSFRESLTTP